MSTTTIRRTAALTTTVAALALPGAAVAMPAPETGYTAPPAGISPTVSAPSSSPDSNNDTLAIVLASGALAIALGGVAYSVKLSAGQRGALN